MEQNEQQVSEDTVALHIGRITLASLRMQEQLERANKAIEELQNQLLKYQKNEISS